MAWYCGTGHFLDFLVCSSRIEHISVSGHYSKILFIYVTIGKALRRGIRASPTLLYTLCSANTISAAIRTLLKGEEWQIKKNPQIFGIGAANAPCFAYRNVEYTQLHLLA